MRIGKKIFVIRVEVGSKTEGILSATERREPPSFFAISFVRAWFGSLAFSSRMRTGVSKNRDNRDHSSLLRRE